MIDSAIIQALTAIVEKNDTSSKFTGEKIEIVENATLSTERIVRMNLNGSLTEVFAHSSHSSHRSHSSHNSHHSHRSSLV